MAEQNGTDVGQLTTLESAFGIYDDKMRRIADYISTITPALGQHPSAVPVFVESMIVVMVARLEHFLNALVTGAVRQRESVVRNHFAENGNDDECRVAQACDLRTLIRMARRRVSFKKSGRSIENIFMTLFEFSPWPSSDVFRVVADLVLLRNVFVHEGDTVLAEHAMQAHRKDVFTSRSYGDLTVYSVQYGNTLLFLREGIVALKEQSDHVRRELLSRSDWTYRSPGGTDIRKIGG